MKVPYRGNVSARLIQKRFSKKVFYYIHNPQGGLPYTIMFGFLKFSGGLLRHPMINYFDSDNVLSAFSQCVNLDNVYETLEGAEVALRLLNNLYEEGFAKRPFIRPERLKTSKGIMVRIENALNILFKGNEKFRGVSFTDVGAGGIQVYCCGYRTTLDYDLNNHIEVLSTFIKYKILKEK